MSGTLRSKARVLVVDDAPANRKLLADLVAREGYEALVATGGAEALEILGSEEVDLVLLDLMMPVVDGLAVLAELKRRKMLATLPVVVVTAHEDRQMRIDALTAGAMDFISKPIDRLEVACRIRTLIEYKRLRQRELFSMEDKLRESDHLYRLHFEQSPVATIAWDADFHVISWNPAAEKLFGHTKVEAMGQHAAFIVSEAHWRQVDEFWSELIWGHSGESTAENVTKDGRTIICEWHNAPITSTDGAILGVSSEILDITERARLQNALMQSQKMDALGQLAGGVAHDLNNIMGVILSYGSFIRDALPDGDPQKDDIIEVLSAADRATALTSQLLAFSRQQPVDKQPVDLNQSLASLRKLLVRTLGDHISLELVPSSGGAVVRIDPIHFDQLVLNLAVNARDAMPEGGRLRITLARATDLGADAVDVPKWVRLTVTDTGVGMDADTQKKIFEPFFTTKEKGRGTGLGLAICFGVVADNGGEIRVQSSVGSGTTFSIELPLCVDALALETALLSKVRASGGGIVLIVEGDAALRKAAARILENAGYAVHVAADGTQARDKLDELGARLDVMVSDIVMPGCSGHDVAEYASHVTPNAAILLTSGFTDDAAGLREPTALPILRKPVPPQELLRAVSEALDSRRMSGASQEVEASGHPAIRIAGHSVLVVEDDEKMRRSMVRILSCAGYIARTTGTIADAQHLLETGPEPHLILCDLNLRDGSGAVLLDWIEETRPALCSRVFVLTGGATDDAGRRVTTSGLFRVLFKPIHPKVLLEALAELDNRP